MAHRHKHHAKGGKVEVDDGPASVIHEAEEKGAKCGGAMHKKHGGKVHGKHGHKRLDKRARGGGVGADKSPFSSAHVKGHVPAGGPHPHNLGSTHHHGSK